jgi:hypothetical protein
LGNQRNRTRAPSGSRLGLQQLFCPAQCAPRSKGEKDVYIGHQPVGLMSPSTVTQPFGWMK